MLSFDGKYVIPVSTSVPVEEELLKLKVINVVGYNIKLTFYSKNVLVYLIILFNEPIQTSMKHVKNTIKPVCIGNKMSRPMTGMGI